MAVIGLNGAGKSTFARCVCGLNKRCRGTVLNKGRLCKGKEATEMLLYGNAGCESSAFY